METFFKDIPDLLSYAYSPTLTTFDDADLFLTKRKKEINYLHSKTLFEIYRKRYFDYAPIGLLEEPEYNYIKLNLTNMILEHQRKMNF